MNNKIFALINQEYERQRSTINLIASENYCSDNVLKALSSILNAKYAEGLSGKRYYGGSDIVDQIESATQKLALKIFGLNSTEWSANVQPYSGSPANLAILTALVKPGQKILVLPLGEGGHLSHGSRSIAGKIFKTIYYHLDPKTYQIDYSLLSAIAKKEKPRMIICGYSSYPFQINFQKFSQIARSINAYLLADIAHIAGLVVGNVHPSPFPWADAVMTTTHKTLRGPRGAIIISKKKLSPLINRALFPGIQGGPHLHQIAGMSICFEEALSPNFKKYAQQIIANSQALANTLLKNKIKLIGGGTQNHLMLVDLRPFKITGQIASWKLSLNNIITNKNLIPFDLLPPDQTSGVRLGTPAVTTRGMKEKEMVQIGQWVAEILYGKASDDLPKKIKQFAMKFPLPGKVLNSK